MKDIVRIEMDMEQKMCTSCKKTSTEYYELKLQIRFTYFENMDEIKRGVIEIINKHLQNINKTEELNKGFDIFFRNHGEMNKIANLFNRHYFIEEKRSKKIVGHDFLRSIDIWRYTQMINIINLNRGDKVSIKGQEYTIKAINKNDLVLIDNLDGSKKVFSYDIIKDYFKLLEKK